MAISKMELEKYKSISQDMSTGTAVVEYDGKEVTVNMFSDEDGDIGFEHNGKDILFHWIKRK